MKLPSSLLLALVLATAAAAPAAAQNQKPPAQAEAPREGARKEVLEPLQAAQALLKEGKAQEAIDKLKAASAVPDRTPYENFFIDQLMAQAAATAGQDVLAMDAYDRALAGNRYNADETQRVLRAQASLGFRAKDYPRSIAYARKLLAQPNLPAEMRLGGLDLVGRALFLNNQHADAAVAIGEWLDAQQAGGTAPTEDNFRLLASAYQQAKDDAGYQRALERLVAAYPKPEYWADLIARVAKQPALEHRLRTELLRLGRVTGAFVQADALLEAADLALSAGLPGDARRVLQAGMDAGTFKSATETTQARQMLALATKSAATDAASADEQARRLKGQPLFALGHALALDGQVDRGLGLMQQGIAQGGLRQPDDAQLQLAVQQLLAGKPEAKQSLALVKGTDGAATLARLWGLHLQSRPR